MVQDVRMSIGKRHS
jgi:prophage maintenance system killer protein